MDDATRLSLVTAAATMTGPNDGSTEDWDERMRQNAITLMVLSDERSPIAKAISQIDDSKKFVAVIESVKKEASSQRGFVTLKTKPSKHHEDGKESARTERMDNAEGLAMAKRLKSLVGHRVLIWIEVVEIQGGSSKVRMVRHVQDLGEADDED